MKLAHFGLLAMLSAGPAIAAPAGELNAAFAAAFGHAAPYTVVASGEAVKKPAKFLYTPSGLVTVAPGTVALISKGNVVDKDCFTCSGTFAIHYLRRDAGKFVLIKAWPVIGMGAAAGLKDGWSLRPDLDTVPVIAFSHDEAGEGCRQSYSQLIALRPDRPVVQAKLLTSVNYDPGSEPDHSPPYHAAAKILPEEKGQRFALLYAGTWKLRVEYQRKGDGYAAKGNEAPACQ